jgi:hypothetical protein
MDEIALTILVKKFIPVHTRLHAGIEENLLSVLQAMTYLVPVTVRAAPRIAIFMNNVLL